MISIFMLIAVFTLEVLGYKGMAQQAKPTLAVMEFDLAANRASRKLGGGLSDMLTNALVESGKYRVVERKRLEEILQEQNLGLDGILDPSTSASVGRMVGAGYLVMGTITEFKENESGGVAGALLGSAIAGVGMYESHIGYTIRIVNSTSGEIILSKSIDKKVKKVGMAGRSLLGIPSGMAGYKSQSMQDAMEQSINEAVQIIEAEISDSPDFATTEMSKAIEIIANNVSFSQLRDMTNHLESLAGITNLKKSLSDNQAHLYFQYAESIDKVADHLMSASNLRLNITGFTESSLELTME